MLVGSEKRLAGSAALVVAALTLLAFTAATAGARVGELDPAFGQAGKIGPELTEYGGASDMAIGPDGSIVLIEGRRLVRLLPSGQPDPGFGDGGRVELPAEIDGLEFHPSNLVLDSEGRMLLSATVKDPSRSTGFPSILVSFPASWAVVLRLTTAGGLDPSFGEGRGYVRSDYGMHPYTSGGATVEDEDFPTAAAYGLQVDSHDRPVLLVATTGMYSPCWGHGTTDWYPRAVVRLTTTGALDAGFGGGDGVAPLDRLAPSPLTVLALDAADQPVVGSGEGSGCPHSGLVFRLGSDGSSLPGFGAEGALAYPRRYLTVIAPSGAMILRGVVEEEVLRVGPDGAPDKTFGGDGEVPVPMLPGVGRIGWPVAVDGRGRTLIAGSFALPQPLPRRHPKLRHPRRKHRTFIAISRLLPDGRVDRGFGKQGWIVTPVGLYYATYLRQVALDPRGRLVVLANASTLRRGSGFVIARYLLDAAGRT